MTRRRSGSGQRAAEPRLPMRSAACAPGPPPLPEEERLEMASEEGVITVDCEFCSRNFRLG